MVFGHSGRPADGPVCMCVIDSATWFSRWIESSNLGTLWQTFWWGSARGNFDLLCTWWTFGETGTGVGQFKGVSGLWWIRGIASTPRYQLQTGATIRPRLPCRVAADAIVSQMRHRRHVNGAGVKSDNKKAKKTSQLRLRPADRDLAKSSQQPGQK
jgi:hypothetical protein